MIDWSSLPAMLGAALSGGIVIGSAVYGLTRDARVTIVVKERDELRVKLESLELSTKEERHDLKRELQASLLETAELRERTNFAPVDERITAFMEEIKADRAEQKNVNEAFVSTLTSISESVKNTSTSQEWLTKTLIEILKKLTPKISEAELIEQEKPLHEE